MNIQAGKTFAEAAQSYVQHGGEAKHVEKLLPHLGEKLLSDIVPIEIKKLADQLYPENKNSTKNRHVLTPVRAVFNHANECGWAPLIRIRSFREDPPTRRSAASPAWLHAFVIQCEKDRLPHLGALVLFMATTGARISEAVRLQWPEVNLMNRTVLLLKTKTSINSTRWLTDQMVGRLYKLQETAKPGEPVFRYVCRHSVNERIRAVCKRAKISYKPSHTCGRHAMANNAIALGIDIKSTMIAGGWVSVPIFLGVYVNPTNSGRLVAERFNIHQYNNDL